MERVEIAGLSGFAKLEPVAPSLHPVGLHLQVEALPVGQFVRLRTQLGVSAADISEHGQFLEAPPYPVIFRVSVEAYPVSYSLCSEMPRSEKERCETNFFGYSIAYLKN